ncbi:BSD domain-containing protein 1-A-like [Gossypium australe]|uniref:BSD domain-containing protein 1-A-like n=1 Tax=Gossypium australe TaxID=47621 RepID=A0A5B6WUM2_9ROSI|nr:BSD domain-containing protein 1-A-like [Gossypium australe]
MERAQECMKQFADKNRSECEFLVGDLVYLKLQPYHQHSLRKVVNQKLSPRYYGPYPIETKIGQVAYKLTLPDESRIHPTFHKPVDHAFISPLLPLVGIDGDLPKVLVKIVDRCIVKRGNQVVTEVLVEWANTFLEDSTWESFSDFR